MKCHLSLSVRVCKVNLVYCYYFDFVFSLPIVLVGNKTDLHMERIISYDEGRRLAESWKAVFLETSAKQNEVCILESAFLLRRLSKSVVCFI